MYLDHLPDADMERLLDSGRLRLTTTRRDLMRAFARVVELSGNRQTTDLHVRRLLCYVRAQDKTYTGAARSIKRIAKKLVLSISTCRRVIRRAVEHFGLLIVIEQRYRSGGQTYNRYTINWDHVDALLCDEDRENAHLEEARQVAKDLSILAEGREPSGSSDLSSLPSTTRESTDMPVRLALPIGSSDLSSDAPVISDQAAPPHASRATTSDPGNTAVPVGSSSAADSIGQSCAHTSLPNARCASCHDQALAAGIKRDLGWIYVDPQADLTIYHDGPPPPPHLHKVFDRLARTPRPSDSNLTPRGQTPPFPIALPQDHPAELLAHFDVLMAKAQTAIDCASRLCPKRRRRSQRKGRRAARLTPNSPVRLALERLIDQLKYRLFSLLYKIDFTKFQASNPAMCRTYLPPINPDPLPDFAELLKAMASRPLQPDFSQHDISGYDFSQHDMSDFDFSQHDMSDFDFSQHDISDFDFSTFNITPDALSDHPPALCPSGSDHPAASIDHPPLEPLRTSSSSAVKLLSPRDSLALKIENLLTAIDELLAAIKAALRCARALRISWLKKRLISWQRRTKTILTRVKRTTTTIRPCGSHPVRLRPARTSSGPKVRPFA